jgi:hypothetical protein
MLYVDKSILFSSLRQKLRCLRYALPCIAIWTLYWIAFWPGLMSIDSIVQWEQVLKTSFSNNYPAFHTLTNWLITRIWFSPAAISAAQIFALATVFSLTIYELELWGISPRVRALITAVFAMSPVNGMMVISLWKDVPYSCAMLALFMIVLRTVRTQGNWLKTGPGMAALFFAALLTSLYRHNGLPVIALFMVVMLTLWRRVCFKQLLRVTFDWIIAVVIITGPIYRIIGVAPMAKFFALQNIMHQIGALTQHGAIESESDRSFLASIQPIADWVKYYDCYSLNVLIYNEHVQHQFVEFHALQVLDVWQRWARKNPAILLEHQRCVTSMLWQIREPREKAGRLYTTELGIVENDLSLRSASLWPRLRYGLVGIVQMTVNPSLTWFFWRPAFYLYFLLLLVALAAARAKNGKLLQIGIPAVLNSLVWFIFIATQDFRFQYPVYVMALIAPALLFVPREKIQTTTAQASSCV